VPLLSGVSRGARESVYLKYLDDRHVAIELLP
jgi:hypothetical protein